eukprot:CAMPEP_0198141998 /NCGR_PEP_ID=MMETSP1443-20131203/4901_1 /TAXON_ID=186043 /ORGANISM="Entomoneis sp., Strain CCMP2396" /LENGTH=67 /DNA_ID=CAMNT_0043804911 /DNA_START=89 /DNA_END=293 /DNA_ORIENTATION=-
MFRATAVALRNPNKAVLAARAARAASTKATAATTSNADTITISVSTAPASVLAAVGPALNTVWSSTK